MHVAVLLLLHISMVHFSRICDCILFTAVCLCATVCHEIQRLSQIRDYVILISYVCVCMPVCLSHWQWVVCAVTAGTQLIQHDGSVSFWRLVRALCVAVEMRQQECWNLSKIVWRGKYDINWGRPFCVGSAGGFGVSCTWVWDSCNVCEWVAETVVTSVSELLLLLLHIDAVTLWLLTELMLCHTWCLKKCLQLFILQQWLRVCGAFWWVSWLKIFGRIFCVF